MIFREKKRPGRKTDSLIGGVFGSAVANQCRPRGMEIEEGLSMFAARKRLTSVAIHPNVPHFPVRISGALTFTTWRSSKDTNGFKVRLPGTVPMRVFARLGAIFFTVVVFLKNAAEGVNSPCIMWTSVYHDRTKKIRGQPKR